MAYELEISLHSDESLPRAVWFSVGSGFLAFLLGLGKPLRRGPADS